MKKFLVFFLVYLVLAMIFFPVSTYKSAQAGFALWYEVVLPALLPFFISAELLLALGAIDYLGYFLEPLMRPLFNLPGSASLALVMGYTSGFPTGAAITASLRQRGSITKEEGERLVSFTNNSSPLFIIISVATGIFARPDVGWLLLSVHYGINLLIGIFWGVLSSEAKINMTKTHQIREPDQTIMPLGKLLKNAAIRAGSNILLIGCYLIFFSVLTNTLTESGVFALFFQPLSQAGIPESYTNSLAIGIWEMTIGINSLGESNLPLGLTLPACSAILAWGGISVQAQVAAMVSDTDIGLRKYIISRVIHALSAFGVTALICHFYPLSQTASTSLPQQPSFSNWQLLIIALVILLVLAVFGGTMRRRQT